jgi:hypothetical protein
LLGEKVCSHDVNLTAMRHEPRAGVLLPVIREKKTTKRLPLHKVHLTV